MIHKLIIENFYSIADVQELSFAVARNAPNSACFLSSRASSETHIPSVIGFFGPNASGKSTILRAIVSTVQFAMYSFLGQPDAPIINFMPYMQKDWWEKPTKILIEFDGQLEPDGPSYLFRYELHISNRKDKFATAVVKENMWYAPKQEFVRLFTRENDEFNFAKEFLISKTDERIKSVRGNASILSTFAQFNHPISKTMLASFQGVQTNFQGNDRWHINPSTWAQYYAHNTKYLNLLNLEIRRLDVGLEAMEIQQSPTGPVAAFKHVGLDTAILSNEESQGTRRFIELFPVFQHVLDTGGTAIVDEIDSDLHPLLLREICQWFCDEKRNPHHGQLLFTAHNPFLLDELEKEQIYFTEKPSGKPTHVYGAKDIQGLRRSPSLLKKYLMGELGAVPHIG